MQNGFSKPCWPTEVLICSCDNEQTGVLTDDLGVFIKMGQHMASLVVLPQEWTSTMAVLQDRCEPTLYEDLESMFLQDMGVRIDELFDNFDPVPIGVASLAQVHVGHHRASGKQVAVKVDPSVLNSSRDRLIEMRVLASASSSGGVFQRGHGNGGCHPRYEHGYLFSSVYWTEPMDRLDQILVSTIRVYLAGSTRFSFTAAGDLLNDILRKKCEPTSQRR